jgi:hypothetical protein
VDHGDVDGKVDLVVPREKEGEAEEEEEEEKEKEEEEEAEEEEKESRCQTWRSCHSHIRDFDDTHRTL